MRRALLVLLLATACSSGSDGALPSRTTDPLPTATATTSAPLPSASPTAVPLVVETASPDDFPSFDTPSGNIACGLSDTFASCEVADHTWVLPPRPADCVDVDWVAAVGVEPGKKATVGSCQSDTVRGSGRVLAYGHALRVGDVQCASYRTGVECVVVGSRHGFFVNRSTYRLS